MGVGKDSKINQLPERVANYLEHGGNDLAELGEKLGLPFKEFQKGIPDRLDSVEAWHRLWQDVSTALSFSVQTRSTVPEQFAFSLFVVGAYRGLLEEVLAVLIESEVPQSGEFRVMRLAGEQESLEALALECAYNLFVEGRITGSDEAAVDAVNPSALFRTVGFLGEYFESTLRFLEESCPQTKVFLRIHQQLQLFTIAAFRIREEIGLLPPTEVLADAIGLVPRE